MSRILKTGFGDSCPTAGRAALLPERAPALLVPMVEPPSTASEPQQDVSPAKAQLEQELRQFQKLEAIGTLAGGIAHAFNNILGAMLGYAQMAKMEAAAVPDALESLDEVLLAGQRGKDLIQKILTFSRRQPSERRLVQLPAVVAEVERLLRPSLPPTIALGVGRSPELADVYADPAQLQQVLMSLVTNAVRALQGRGGKISIQLQNLELSAQAAAERALQLRPGKYLELAVMDDGCGMEPAMLERIFEPFFSTKTPGEGSGLGLSVVYGIVTDHQGVVRVDSQPGLGSRFRVLLPAAESGAASV